MSIDVPNYRILDKLGVGAGSTIYKAKSISTGAIYAIKHIKVHSPEDRKLVDQVRDEHACCSVLDHPVLRKTFDLQYVHRRLRVKAVLLFMEYVDGDTLIDCAEDCSLTDLLKIMERAAEGLDALHKAGFVHADLKPGNIMRLNDGGVKLIDFGQSSPMNQAKTRIQGTINYMAPEQSAKNVLNAKTDIFGLGATLHKILTGDPIATDMNQKVNIHSLNRVGQRIVKSDQPAREELPPVITKLITDCCEHDPEKRIKDMVEFIERSRIARAVLARRARQVKRKAAAARATEEKP